MNSGCNRNSGKEEKSIRKPNKYNIEEFKTRLKGTNSKIDSISYSLNICVSPKLMLKS